MNKVYCNDGCQGEFNITDMKEGIERLPDKIERHYIQCPKCAQQYTSYYLNDDMKKIQQEIQTLQRHPQLKVKQKNRIMKLSKSLQAMNETLKLKMTDANASKQ